MSKIIPVTAISDIHHCAERLYNAYSLREALIRMIADYNRAEDSLKKDSHFRFKYGVDLIARMDDKNVSDRLELDEIIAIAECRIKKANVTIADCIAHFEKTHGIHFEDKR